MNVGVVGLGYVGSACESLFKDYFNLNTFDINKNCNCSSIQDLTKKSDIIFICLPTPMRKDRVAIYQLLNLYLSKLMMKANKNTLSLNQLLKSALQIDFQKNIII